MDTNDRMCLICGKSLEGTKNVSFCCNEHREVAKVRGKRYWQRYGKPCKQTMQGLQTLPHRKSELQLPGYWIHDHDRG